MQEGSPELRSVNIGDTDLRYLLYDADGPTIIMMHATGFLPWLWHPIARGLSSYRIIAPYFCDHRTAEPEDGGLEWMVLANDLCALCQALGIVKPFMVGHSMGATVITLAHARNGMPAEGMVLIEPIFLPEDLYRVKLTVEQHPLASKSIRRRDFWRTREEVADYLKSRKLFEKWDSEVLDLYLHYGFVGGASGGYTLSCSPRREASLFMGGQHCDPWPLLETVLCPVLVVEGSESENRPFIDLTKAALMFGNGHYRLIEGAGHLIPMERPREVESIIREFFDRKQ